VPASRRALEIPISGTGATVVLTSRADGDVRPGHPLAEERLTSLAAARPVASVRQVHGAGVLHAPRPAAGLAATTVIGLGEADAVVSGGAAASPAMFAADCALLGLASREGVTAAVHCGWRGLLAGVVGAAAIAMRAAGATELSGVRGACIGAECYEFGEDDLAALVARFGRSVRSETADGRPALDLGAGVRIAAEDAGIRLEEVPGCTACAVGDDGSAKWFSHRARGDEARHALVVLSPA
jgi:hypothetical protein